MTVTQLAQQELLEAPPRRRLQVPPDHRDWWGIDPSSTRVAVGAAAVEPSDGSVHRWTALRPFPTVDGAQRLSVIYEETKDFVADLVRCNRRPPGLVWIEQPSGARENPNLSYAVGVTVAAVYDGLYDVTGFPPRVEMVPSATWKKLATGFGGHWKPTKKKLGRTPVFEDYGIARWARANGYAGDSWDEADALGIAEAARREVALVAR